MYEREQEIRELKIIVIGGLIFSVLFFTTIVLVESGVLATCSVSL